MKMPHLQLSSLLAVGLLCGAHPAFADSNLQADFATIGQPGSPWTIGWATGPGQPITAFDPAVTNAVENTTVFQSAALGSDSPIIMQDGDTAEITLQRGAGGLIGIVRWTSPWTGAIALDASFGADKNGIVDFMVYSNANHYSIADLIVTAPSVPVIFGYWFNAGDSVDFMSFSKDATSLRVTMAPPAVPDSGSTATLFALAAFALVAVRRRFRVAG